MRFFYKKELSIASDWNYDNSIIINWFINKFDPIEYLKDYYGDLDPDYLVDIIFDNVDEWDISFMTELGIEQGVQDNISNEDLIEQLEENIKTNLVNYYKSKWDEFVLEYENQIKDES